MASSLAFSFFPCRVRIAVLQHLLCPIVLSAHLGAHLHHGKQFPHTLPASTSSPWVSLSARGLSSVMGAPTACLHLSMGQSEAHSLHFLRGSPAGVNPVMQSHLLMSSPFTACLPPLFPHKPTQASWDHLPKPLCSPVLVSKSAFGNSSEDKYLPQGLLWPLEQENKTKPGSMLIQTGDSKTGRNLFFYCTLFTSKFSCTGGLGHFPRWNACPSAAPKRPARAGSSSSAGIIFGLGVWTRTCRGESKAAGGIQSL